MDNPTPPYRPLLIGLVPLPVSIITIVPELLGAVTEGAGLDTDIADDDDEMSGVTKEKHRRRQDY